MTAEYAYRSARLEGIGDTDSRNEGYKERESTGLFILCIGICNRALFRAKILCFCDQFVLHYFIYLAG